MLARNSFPRRQSFASVVSWKKHIRSSSFNLAARRLRIPEDGVVGSLHAKQDGGRRVGKTILYVSGLGIVSTGFYYLLVNGPSRSAPTSTTVPLSPTHFTPATLTTTISSTPYTKILTLSIPLHLVPDSKIHPCPIFSIYVKDSDIQVERPYTPLEGIDAQGHMRFWVKQYQSGEVGRWLHERKVGDEIEVRGPILNWKWQDGDWDEIVMISGGTGITPFYQLMHNVFSLIPDGTMPITRFQLLHSSPTPSDLPPRSVLDPLQSFAQLHPEFFTLRLFVDTMEPKTSRQDLPSNIATGRIGRRALELALAPAFLTADPWWKRLWSPFTPPGASGSKILFLVCGPEPMVTAIAGPRVPNLTQGCGGGVLGEMGFELHQVCKL